MEHLKEESEQRKINEQKALESLSEDNSKIFHGKFKKKIVNPDLNSNNAYSTPKQFAPILLMEKAEFLEKTNSFFLNLREQRVFPLSGIGSFKIANLLQSKENTDSQEQCSFPSNLFDCRNLIPQYTDTYSVYKKITLEMDDELGFMPKSVLFEKRRGFVEDKKKPKRGKLKKKRAHNSKGVKSQKETKDENESKVKNSKLKADFDEEWYKKVSFEIQDASNINCYVTESKKPFTHVYSYNKIMKRDTISDICTALNQSQYLVLSWYFGPHETYKCGLRNFKMVYKTPMLSTGGEKFTVYVYIRLKNNIIY